MQFSILTDQKREDEQEKQAEKSSWEEENQWKIALKPRKEDASKRQEWPARPKSLNTDEAKDEKVAARFGNIWVLGTYLDKRNSSTLRELEITLEWFKEELEKIEHK